MRKWLAPAVLAGFVGAASPALADDPGAAIAVKLFVKACIPAMGRPDLVRTWAQDNHLPEITDPAPRQVFAGEGDGGAAWAVPTASGNFALAIRGHSKACAVFAQQADPAEVEADFRKIVEGVKRPGIDVSVYQDRHDSSPHGDIHSLSFTVSMPSASGGFVFLMQTVEQAGGAFQASLEVGQGSK